MKKTFINLCVAVAVTAGLAAPEARAQLAETPEQSGTAAADHLLVPVTAHAAGLANAYTSGLSSLSGLEGAMMNPAALMLNQGTGAMFSRMQYVADIGVNSFGVAQRFGANNVALQITAWDFGDIERREEDDPNGDGGLTYTASDIVVGATFARQMTDRVSAGITAKFINESIDDMTASAIAFDAGMTYEVGASGLRFGVSLRNFGPSLSYGGNGLVQDIPVGTNGTIAGEVAAVSNELPSMLNFGVAYTRALSGDITVTGLGNFRSNAYDAD
ncbi:MAG TPA: PorV/PorQ family protein, partial [Rhodothermales bacterium]|nr:PorV/PorQ family protein [Rhodothermales bacterium]